MKSYNITTLNEFIIQKQAEFPYAKGELSRILSHVGIASKIVSKKIRKAGLVDLLGDAGEINVQGENQQKLDIFADEIFISALRASGEICGLATEENQEIVTFDDNLSKDAKYIFLMDPLDGSSNIDVNVSVGTIFCIYRRISKPGQKAKAEDFVQVGSQMIAAGYVLYGSSTMMVYTTGHGVNGFTLDPTIGEFCLSHPNMKTPEYGTIYSINEGNYIKFPDGVKHYIKHCQEVDQESNRPYSSRYIGSLVADFHRNLTKGGIFMYPSSPSSPKGKLRLTYECNPIAFIAEQAGGKASDGKNRILDIKPDSPHMRVPYYVGSRAMVDKLEQMIADSKE